VPLTKCPRCHRLFEKMHAAVCPRCQSAEDADYDKIRAVLDHSPNLNAEQVAEVANVPLECVMRMIDEGLVSNVSLTQKIKCGRCGAPAISMSRRLCQACLEKLNSEVASAQSKLRLQERGSVKIGEFKSARKTLEDKMRE
jgi:NMD protein affecting ribosome stability and mRNA decay